MFLVGAADHLGVGPLRDLDDLALGPPLAIDADDAGDGPVAVQDLVHLLGGQEEIRPAALGHQEAEAIRMPLDPAADQVRLVGDQPVAAAVLQHLAIPGHGAEAPGKGIPFAVRHVQQVAQSFEGDGGALGLQDIQHVFAAGQRMFVFCEFPVQEGIGPAHLGKVLGGGGFSV